jgi:hypothetical protein
VVIIFVYIFKFLTSGIKAISLADIVGKYFYFCIFFSVKKKTAQFQKFLVYLCEKIS